MLTEDKINSVMQELRSTIPEFADEVDRFIEEKEGYAAFERLADFVKKLIDTNGPTEIINRVYTFVNCVCDTKDSDIQDWLRVTFLESMIQGKEYIQASKKLCLGNSLSIVNEMLASGYWRTDY